MIDAYWLLRGYTINTQYSSTFTAFYDENALSCHPLFDWTILSNIAYMCLMVTKIVSSKVTHEKMRSASVLPWNDAPHSTQCANNVSTREPTKLKRYGDD